MNIHLLCCIIGGKKEMNTRRRDKNMDRALKNETSIQSDDEKQTSERIKHGGSNVYFNVKKSNLAWRSNVYFNVMKSNQAWRVK